MKNLEVNRDLIGEFQANVWANYFYNIQLLRLRGYSSEKLENLDLVKGLYEMGGCFSKLFSPADLDKDTYSEICKGDKEIVRSMQKAAYFNDRLVMIGAHRHKYFAGGLSLEDLHSYGYDGLIRSLYGFDPKLGTCFSTYAYTWIRQSIIRAIHEHSGEIRFPNSKFDLKIKIRKTADKLGMDFCNLEDDQIGVISETLGVKPDWLKKVISDITIHMVPFELPYDSAYPEETRLSFSKVLKSPWDDPEELLLKQELIERVERETKCLDERARTIVMLHLGGETTLEEIGEDYRVSRERVRQIEAKAIRKLRRNKNLENMALGEY